MVRIRRVVGDLGGEGRLPLMPETMAWRGDPKLSLGGRVFDSAWHNFATAMWWIGDVEKVTAVVSKTEDHYMEAPCAITWKFEDRDCLATFEMISAPEMYIRGKYYAADVFFEIQGSRGLIWVTRCSGEMLDMPPVVLHTGTETTRRHGIRRQRGRYRMAQAQPGCRGRHKPRPRSPARVSARRRLCLAGPRGDGPRPAVQDVPVFPVIRRGRRAVGRRRGLHFARRHPLGRPYPDGTAGRQQQLLLQSVSQEVGLHHPLRRSRRPHTKLPRACGLPRGLTVGRTRAGHVGVVG